MSKTIELNNKHDNDSEENLKFYQKAKFKKGLFIFLVLASVFTFAIAVFRLESILAVIGKVLSYIKPIFYGIAMAYLLNPVVMFLQIRLEPFLLKHMKNKKKAVKIAKNSSIALSVIFGLALITILCVMIIPELLFSISKLAQSLPRELERVIDFLKNGIDTSQFWGETLKRFIDTAFEALNNWLENGLPEFAGAALQYLTDSVINIIGFLVNFFIGIVVCVYALCDKDKFRGETKKFIYAVFKPERANSIIDTARHGHYIFGGFLTGKIIDSIIVGIICAVFMMITRMPYVLLVSVIIGVTNIIPFFGPFIGGIPSALLLLIMNPMDGLIFIVFIIILQQIDGNIIGPWILGSKTGISEFWVTFALLLFGGIFGVAGMIIGVPLFAVIYYIFRKFINNHLREKNMSVVSDEYCNIDRYDEETGQFKMFPDDYLEMKRKLKKGKPCKFCFWKKIFKKKETKDKDKNKSEK